ncbi:MOXD1 homolog 1 [Anthonomus grandis grandis]|uniref:MOXD1 homolog 1 n=1 Tax=Anthonomus grandis grandis TaxID=2921223 RepID=UPI00216511D2|nr:MOXD1 homolog 1 [Anthonomus grandis grandis]
MEIYSYDRLLIYFALLTSFLGATSTVDLLDQYVEHIQLVNTQQDDPRTFNTKQSTTRRKLLQEPSGKETSDILWTHSMMLDKSGLVTLRWQPRHQEILFRVEAKTLGYVGLGFSPTGSMEGADIVMGWVDDKQSKAVLLDCHGVSKNQGSAPVRDLIDNYTLMRGSQNGTHTVIEFRRVLDTCDADDYVLAGDTVRVIWALHDRDPRYPGDMVYHEEKRGVQSVHLFGPPPSANIRNEYVRSWDVELKNFKIPSNMDTIYWCKVFKAPTFNEKHHITGYEPIIGKNHSDMVHHMIMHECELDEGANLAVWEGFAKGEGRSCYNNMPVEWEKCLTPLIAWGIGSRGENFPNHVGLPLARKKNSYYMLEVHFDNPQMRTAIGTSGLRLHYTNKLRENEGGILITGVAPSTLHFIPPYQAEYKTAGYCSLDCTREVFPKDGINVVSVMLHSHLAGRKLKLRHIRAGKELPPLAEDNHYDFNYQQSRALSQDTTILPGDGLITECTYSTLGRTRPTLGGYSTREEMCLSFVMYYPRTELAGCYSIPPVKYFFKNLGVSEFYGKNMTEVEKALLEGKIDSETIVPSTEKPFETSPGDEMSPEANLRAIMALRNAKEYSIDGESVENSVFEKLIIKEPQEFSNKSFMQHLQDIPYNETILTKNIEEYFYSGLHMTFCRKRDDTLAIKENIERLPVFQPFEYKENIQCSYKSKRAFPSSAPGKLNNFPVKLLLSLLFILWHTINY